MPNSDKLRYKSVLVQERALARVPLAEHSDPAVKSCSSWSARCMPRTLIFTNGSVGIWTSTMITTIPMTTTMMMMMMRTMAVMMGDDDDDDDDDDGS